MWSVPYFPLFLTGFFVSMAPVAQALETQVSSVKEVKIGDVKIEDRPSLSKSNLLK